MLSNSSEGEESDVELFISEEQMKLSKNAKQGDLLKLLIYDN